MSEEQEKLNKIVKAIRDGPLNITRIAKRARMSRATAAKYLLILKEKGKVVEDDSDKPHKKFRLA